MAITLKDLVKDYASPEEAAVAARAAFIEKKREDAPMIELDPTDMGKAAIEKRIAYLNVPDLDPQPAAIIINIARGLKAGMGWDFLEPEILDFVRAGLGAFASHIKTKFEQDDMRVAMVGEAAARASVIAEAAKKKDGGQ